MNGRTNHPGTEELAEFGAGVADGARGDWVAAHIADCPECASLSARLDEVSALLTAVPKPAMPEDVSRRILAAIQAQPREDAVPDLGAPDASHGGVVITPRRSRWFRKPAGALLAGAACIVLAVVGYQLSESSGPAAPPASSGTHAAGPSGISAGGASPHHDSRSPVNSAPAFFVTQTSVNYRTATLTAQVRQQVAAQDRGHSTTSPSPTASGSPSAGGGVGPALAGPDRRAPSKQLADCVLHLTRNSTPMLVEQATYQSQAVYVIVVRNHAWIVTTSGCTPAHPDIVASVSLRPAVG